ncbi:hypothetical protein BH11VER1_BH11VER1_06300 [soil metagenome]
MKSNELDTLIEDCLEGNLSEADAARLSGELQASPEARARYWEASTIHGLLEHTMQQLSLRVITGQASPRPMRWLQWRPLMAAAAGIMFGMFCTSMVYGYVLPRAGEALMQRLALANADFEETVVPLPDGVPVKFGVWSGDYAEIVGEQQGVVPHEGKHMLRFLRSDSAVAPGIGGNTDGNLYQIVDMRAYRNEIADGKATVDWSAWFNHVPTEQGREPKFRAGIWTFTGDSSILTVNWSQHLYLETAKCARVVEADSDLRSWQRLEMSMLVPPDTDFLLVELKMMPNPTSLQTGVATFRGAYADHAELLMHTSARQTTHFTMASP